MKRIVLICSFCLLFSSFAFGDEGMADLSKIYKEIMDKFGKKDKNGKRKINPKDYNLVDLFGVGADMGGFHKIFGEGGGAGMAAFQDGGVLGGMMGLLQDLGMETLHNDASMNINVTAAIIYTKKRMRPQIAERQRKIMERQDTINMRIQELTRLEQKTLDYWSDKQEDAVDIEDMQYFSKITGDCNYFFNKCKEVAAKNEGFEPVMQQLNLHVILSAANIAQRVSRFIKVDGTKNLLDNQDRDKLISEVIAILRELRGTIARTYRAMAVSANYKFLKQSKK